MQDLNDKITGSTLTAAEWNEIPSEIQNVIEDLGITLSGGDLNQLGKAIAGYVANGTFYTDSGAADAYVLTVIGSKQRPTAYTNGLEAEFIIGNTNTGSSTINVAGLGAVDIAGTGAAGTLTTGDIVRLLFNLATGDFDIVNNTGAVSANASETVKGIVELATQAETDTGADDLRAITPLKLGNAITTVKAWANFNGTGTVAIRSDFNVSSITDNGVGNYTPNFGSPLSDTDYCVVVGGGVEVGTLVNQTCRIGIDQLTTNSFRIRTTAFDNGSGDLKDLDNIMFSILAN